MRYNMYVRINMNDNKLNSDIILLDADENTAAAEKCRCSPVTSGGGAYWNNMVTRIFSEDSGCIDYDTPVDTRLQFIPALKPFSIAEDLRGTRFEDETDPLTLIRMLLLEFIKWADTVKGRLPVPDYDIADDRLDNEKETEFYHIVQKWLYATLMKDAWKFSGTKNENRCDEARVRNVSWSLAVVFCAYYHHAFDID